MSAPVWLDANVRLVGPHPDDPAVGVYVTSGGEPCILPLTPPDPLSHAGRLAAAQAAIEELAAIIEEQDAELAALRPAPIRPPVSCWPRWDEWPATWDGLHRGRIT